MDELKPDDEGIDESVNETGAPGADEASPQVATIAQYIKDLSVENPAAPQSFQWQVQPQLEVRFHINVNRINEEVHEVALKIDASARSEQGVHFVVDLTYAGLFGLRNIPDEALPPFLLAEAPRLLFPFARAIIANCVQDCGFPPLLLDPIDFAAAYLEQAEAAAAAGDGPLLSGNGGNGGAAGEEPTIQ